jgi:hypothetical protein
MGFMLRYAAPVLLSLVLCACKPAQEGHVQAIIGAVLIDGAGGPPLTNSVVVVAGGRIRAAGSPSNIPIPADADKINGAGNSWFPHWWTSATAPIRPDFSSPPHPRTPGHR